MDQRERIGDLQTAVQVALSALQSEIWTALPGEVQSFDPVAMTCEVQPTIQGKVRDKGGVVVDVAMPLLLDCPVYFPSGGGCTLTFPIKKGDECLVVFASRCIDSWWQSGGIQAQAEFRMHDLSDGFAFVGFRSRPRVLANVSATATQLRSDDGQAYVQLNPISHEIDVVTPGKIGAQAGGDITASAGGNMVATAIGAMTLTAPQITLNGAVLINGPLSQGTGAAGGGATMAGPLAVANDVTAGGKSLLGHTHHENGAGNNTSPPI